MLELEQYQLDKGGLITTETTGSNCLNSWGFKGTYEVPADLNLSG